MRNKRIKPQQIDIFYHLYNRVAGDEHYLPFGASEKEHFTRLLHKLSIFFTIRVVSYQVMSNHFHLVAHAPGEPPSPEEVCRRYQAYYQGKRKLDPTDPYCRVLAERMRDISWFMHDLQQQFSSWFNRTRSTRRRGSLWAERFKHTLLGNAQAVWQCIKYIEMNPVRAGMVPNPADYRFGSYGYWSAVGHHPFEHNVNEVLLPWLEGIYPFKSVKQLHTVLQDTFTELTGIQVEPDKKLSRFVTQIDRRVRYWVDGLLIGSELFIQEMISRSGGNLRPRERGLTFARGPDEKRIEALCCYKHLRAL